MFDKHFQATTRSQVQIEAWPELLALFHKRLEHFTKRVRDLRKVDKTVVRPRGLRINFITHEIELGPLLAVGQDNCRPVKTTIIRRQENYEFLDALVVGLAFQ